MNSLLWTLLLACGARDAPDTEPSQATVTGASESEASDTESAVDSPLSGVITDTSGAPVEARVSMCLEVCITVWTDQDGAYSFTQLDAGTWSFEVVPVDVTLATVLVPLPRSEDEQRALSVGVPALEMMDLPQTAEPVEVASGLTLTVGQDNLTAAFGSDLDDIGGVAVPEALWPPLDTLSGEPVALWYLHPFDAHASEEAGVAVALDNDWALEPGAELELWAASYTDFAFLPAGTVTVSEDGSTLTGADAGVPVLSTLVLVQP